jgi:hypothetical protein
MSGTSWGHRGITEVLARFRHGLGLRFWLRFWLGLRLWLWLGFRLGLRLWLWLGFWLGLRLWLRLGFWLGLRLGLRFWLWSFGNTILAFLLGVRICADKVASASLTV